jgi:hypothetical protein
LTSITRSRWVLLGAIALVVLTLHLGALSLLGPGWFDPQGPAMPAALLRVRSVLLVAPPPAPAQETALMPPAATLVPPVQTVRPARGPTAKTAAASAVVPVAVTPPAREPTAVPAAPDTPIAGVGHASTEWVDVPVYPTRMPPAGRWRYRLQRGLLIGSAELDWAPQPDARYALQLQGWVAGVSMLDWLSQGQLDAAGIAPARFAVRRRGRDTHAANFQREAGKITFSGPTHELPLLPGAQDRLSWLLQLPAIVAAAPERFIAGTSVVIFVTGARGDADVWTFAVQGFEVVDGRPALKLVREPRRLYGLRAEVWLDPAEHHLPVRVVQSPTGGGAALALQRERP